MSFSWGFPFGYGGMNGTADHRWDGQPMDRWEILQVYMDSFFWFWLFWGSVALVLLILHIFRLCYDAVQDHKTRALLPVPVESVFSSAHSDDFKTCSICLEDFVESDKLHWLPCSHVFHAACIDEWIKGNHLACPVCLTPAKSTEGTPLGAIPPANYQTIQVDPPTQPTPPAQPTQYQWGIIRPAINVGP
eukprot:comp44865_c0_seq1/m.47523 comp44865_c0_seq1/g.47523  ORF comp44865_c0_seq1/g.47523 comp44865_c0_seq1/m.47523 type:complete len:190 (-) comp44865_c0_seq1:897-1466(-)